ncbi:Oidioi.mRNA.OKI2018_I69.PAR.g9190.t1.cds [Oikopleura dioica]|uniref:Oidioi.mRNA.OKI2018_I69.PAR.g9190.t1.cds n=1 Tax=Oikopleura dioica TaxID=34765 RepID=A0ABN7RJE4_OIKDI|nr:Oidioi.mRNA.OKI2018_I69.PAR.g9190.t1.cds [Oikopleura dioica]
MFLTKQDFVQGHDDSNVDVTTDATTYRTEEATYIFDQDNDSSTVSGSTSSVEKETTDFQTTDKAEEITDNSEQVNESSTVPDGTPSVEKGTTDSITTDMTEVVTDTFEQFSTPSTLKAESTEPSQIVHKTTDAEKTTTIFETEYSSTQKILSTVPKYCDGITCLNGGTCNEMEENFSCDCIDPFTGEYCQDHPCDGFCQNHGVCALESEIPTCSCRDPYKRL